MLYLIRCLFCLCALLVWPFTPAGAKETSATPPQPASAATASKSGLFYEVRSDTNTVYLFGTIHVGKPDFYPLSKPVMRALTDAKYLAVEADTSDAAAALKYLTEFALYPSLSGLDRDIPPPLLERLNAALKQYNFPKEQAMAMRPWTIAMTLGVLEAARQGYDSNWGVDGYLIAFAKEQKKAIVELEGLRQQFEIFGRLSKDQQRTFLEETLQDLEKGEAKERLSNLVDAWLAADRAALEKEWQYLNKDSRLSYRFTVDKLLNERNVRMARQVEEFLRSRDSYFVAVGTLHLVGEKNIVDLLKGRGYRVREL